MCPGPNVTTGYMSYLFSIDCQVHIQFRPMAL
jgi:hypothetical protein